MYLSSCNNFTLKFHDNEAPIKFCISLPQADPNREIFFQEFFNIARTFFSSLAHISVKILSAFLASFNREVPLDKKLPINFWKSSGSGIQDSSAGSTLAEVCVL